MKAITIHQPWATLIAIGEKQFETRGWETKYRGPIAIHAGQKVDKSACEQEPIKSILALHGYAADNLPTGAIVATAELVECWKWYGVGRILLRAVLLIEYEEIGKVSNHKEISEQEEALGWFGFGRRAFELAAVRQLPHPIPAKGQQRLWNWEGRCHHGFIVDGRGCAECDLEQFLGGVDEVALNGET